MASLAVRTGRESTFPNALREHGYVEGRDIGDSTLFQRRDRSRTRVAVRDGDLTAVASGSTSDAARGLLAGILEREETTATAGEPAVDRLVDVLGDGTVLSISPQAGTDVAANDAAGPTPLVTGGRVTIRESVLDCREGAVYASASDRKRAERERDGGPDRRLSADGAVLVTDRLLDRSAVTFDRR